MLRPVKMPLYALQWSYQLNEPAEKSLLRVNAEILPKRKQVSQYRNV
jgi:hypothetical protein